MGPEALEWLNLLLRVAHVIAAIMWIGDSFLFMWMDSNLRKPERPREGDVIGELYMAHGGGFYELVKRRSLATLPEPLHTFKWESYTTWITGFFLLTVVYYLSGPAMLLDAGSTLSHGAAVAISLGALAGGVVVYQTLCRTPLVDHKPVFALFGLLAITAVAYGFSQLFAARAVFIQVGAMLGSIMSSNVLLRIIPAQREMLAATREGRAVDTRPGAQAKRQSTHNHYLTLPVLFMMLSNHFPAVYGHPQSWLVLALIVVFAVGVKVFMNERGQMPSAQLVATAVALLVLIAMTTTPRRGAAYGELTQHPKVGFATVQTIVKNRCVVCHAAQPLHAAYATAPMGVRLETPEEIQAQAGRIFTRAVHTHTMPLGNMTVMTDEERTLVGAWIAQGARLTAVDAPPPSAAAAPVAPRPSADLFSTRCALCHGPGGRGDGPASAGLSPRPRDFSDPAWQASVTDEALTQVIVGGGAGAGKSPLMPANPDLADQPEQVRKLIEVIRGFGR